MPSPKIICKQITQILGYLVEVGLSSDQNYPFIKESPNNIVEVTFPHSEHLSIALKNRSYAEIYHNLDSERAYITKLPDGALVTMRYLYRDNQLERHYLSFYKVGCSPIINPSSHHLKRLKHSCKT
jgi:hypothetical protein